MGYFVSSLLAGYVSDKYGRLFAWKIFVSLEVVMTLAQALAPGIWWLLAARLVCGIGGYGRCFTGRLLCE